MTTSARAAAWWKAARRASRSSPTVVPQATPRSSSTSLAGHVAVVGVDRLAREDLVAGAEDLDAHGQSFPQAVLARADAACVGPRRFSATVGLRDRARRSNPVPRRTVPPRRRGCPRPARHAALARSRIAAGPCEGRACRRWPAPFPRPRLHRCRARAWFPHPHPARQKASMPVSPAELRLFARRARRCALARLAERTGIRICGEGTWFRFRRSRRTSFSSSKAGGASCSARRRGMS